jgi:hypothetical protein
MLEAGQVTEFGHEAPRDSALDAPQGLQRLNHGVSSPGVDVVMQFLLQTLQACGVLGDRPDVCVENDRLRGRGPDHCGAPPPMGWTPGGPARVPDILPQPEGFEPKLGGLAVPQGICAGAGALANGFGLDRRNIDRGEISRAPQAREWDRITPVGVHAVAGLCGPERRRDDPADLAFLRQITIEPGPTGSGFIDEDPVWGFGVQRAHALINVAWPSANGAEVDHLSIALLGDISYGDGVVVDLETTRECARLWHGGPPLVDGSGFDLRRLWRFVS